MSFCERIEHLASPTQAEVLTDEITKDEDSLQDMVNTMEIPDYARRQAMIDLKRLRRDHHIFALGLQEIAEVVNNNALLLNQILRTVRLIENYILYKATDTSFPSGYEIQLSKVDPNLIVAEQKPQSPAQAKAG